MLLMLVFVVAYIFALSMDKSSGLSVLYAQHPSALSCAGIIVGCAEKLSVQAAVGTVTTTVRASFAMGLAERRCNRSVVILVSGPSQGNKSKQGMKI